MSYKNIKGIIVEIGGDTSGLQKALKDVNSKTASLSKELRGINSMLKLDPKSTELLSQKQKVLKEDIKETTKYLNGLKEAQRLYIQQGGNLNTAEYRSLKREIIENENKLKQFKLEASNWTKASKGLSEFSSKMKSLGDKIGNIGKQLTTKVTVPIVSLGTLATKSAIEFESAFTGVEKTVDGTTKQMEELKEGIRKMAKEIPSTTTEISAVAEAAGQLGIKTEDILSFTRVMIDLGNSTNLSSTEAASALAKFANVTKMSSKDYDRLGSTIVALGNNFATTEADIVSMATRLAATGELAGLNQSQILSLATAMSSVGIEAEAGGSAMSKLLKKIQVATETGSKDLKKFSSVAGLSSKDFKKAFQEDAVKALSMFIKGLNDTKRNGKSAVAVLEDMGLTEVRLSNTILSLANASDVMTNAVELGSDAWKENTALANESNKRYQTLESQIKKAKNTINDLAITIGEKIMPYVQKILNKIVELTEKFNKLNPKIQDFIIKAAMIAAVVGPVLIILGKLITFGGQIFSGLSKIIGLIAKTQVGLGGLSSALTFLSGPVGIIVAAIAALTAAFVYLYNTNEQFRTSINDTWGKVADVFNNNVKPAFDNLITSVKELWENYIKPFGEFLWNYWSPMLELTFDKISSVFGTLFTQWQKILGHIMNALSGLIDFITGVFSGNWEKAWRGITEMVSNIFGAVVEYVKIPVNVIIDLLNNAIKGINMIKIPDWVPNIGGKGINIPLIPKLAKGGIFDKATLAMIGEGKSAEAVIPLDRTLTKYMAEAMKQAGGTRNIEVNFYPKQMTESELDRAFNYIDKRYGLAY